MPGPLPGRGRNSTTIYVLLPYIIYVMKARCFSQSPAFLSRTAKERDKKYIVNLRSGTKCKTPLLFCPALLKSGKNIVNNHSFCLIIKLTITKETRGRVSRGRDYRWRDCRGRVLRDFSLFKPNLKKHEGSQCHLQLLC